MVLSHLQKRFLQSSEKVIIFFVNKFIDSNGFRKTYHVLFGLSGKEELGQAEGWRPMSKEALAKRLSAQARSLSGSDSDSAVIPDSDSADVSDSDSGDVELEDREAEDSYLSPLYAPAPGGLAGGYGPGYGGYGPYIYIVPIVLPAAGRPPGPAAGHVVTETGHQSHHYRHAQYQPIYGGSYGGEGRR